MLSDQMLVWLSENALSADVPREPCPGLRLRVDLEVIRPALWTSAAGRASRFRIT